MLSKCDALTPELIAERADALKKAARKKPLLASAVSGFGVSEVLYALAQVIERSRKEEREESEAQPEARAWQP